MSDVQLTVIDQQDTQLVLSTPGILSTSLMMQDGSNSALALGSAGTPSLKFAGDANTGIFSPGADQLSVTTGGTERLRIDSTGQIEAVSLGSAAAPTFSFTGDPNTGVYSPGADQLAISTGGLRRLFIQNNEFRFGAPDNNTVVFNIGNEATGDRAVYTDLITDTTYTDFGLRLGREGGANSTSFLWHRGTGDFLFIAGEAAPIKFSTSSVERARIDGTGGFRVKGAGAAGSTDAFFINGSAPASSFVLDSTGRVGIGTTSPAYALDVSSGDIRLKRSAANNAALYFGATTNNYIFGTSDDNLFVFATNGSERARIESTGGFRVKGAGTAGSTDAFFINGSAPASSLQLDSSGRLLVGTSSSISEQFSGQARLQTAGTNYYGLASFQYSNDGIENVVSICKSRGASVGTHTVVQNNDNLGMIRFQGSDGTGFLMGASITAAVDGTAVTNAGSFVVGRRYKILTVGDTNFTLIGASANTIGVIFAATGVGTGTGTATSEPYTNSMPGRLAFSTTADGASNPTERMRINAAGFVKCGNTGAYSLAAGSGHEFYNTLNDTSLVVTSSNGSYAANAIYGNIHRTANAAYNFLVFDSGNSADREFTLTGAGNGNCDGAWTGGGADYAEYFEWSDENPDAEDRRGISVVLDGDKIREAQTGEDPIGVISGNPSVVGDAAWNKWTGKYLRDEYGTYIQEDYEVTDDDGNTVIQQRRKLNPAYDPDVEYVSREQRPEWDCVGLMGKLRIRKGQITGSRWIKMRDINASVEEWLVR